MAELPASWDLTVKQNALGKAEVWGKADDGSDYRVRSCDTAGITDKDVFELRAADRESYSNRESGVRQFVSSLAGESKVETAENFDDSEWIGAAEPVVDAGFGRVRFGYSRGYARNFDKWIDSIKGA
jgi:hypothetical protein